MYFTASGTKKNRYNNAQNVHIKDLSQYSKVKLYKNWDTGGQQTQVAEALTISVGVMLTGGGTI